MISGKVNSYINMALVCKGGFAQALIPPQGQNPRRSRRYCHSSGLIHPKDKYRSVISCKQCSLSEEKIDLYDWAHSVIKGKETNSSCIDKSKAALVARAHLKGIVHLKNKNSALYYSTLCYYKPFVCLFSLTMEHKTFCQKIIILWCTMNCDFKKMFSFFNDYFSDFSCIR